MKKILIVILSLVFTLTGCYRSYPDGDIIILTDTLEVGETIPIVFEVPEEYDDLHKEMWACELKNGEETSYRDDYIEEHFDLEENYDRETVEVFFKDSPVDIYRDDFALDSLYSPRILLFTPMESGTYIFTVSGYYHSTSPSDYVSLEVTVNEKTQ